ncbi:MAG: hypothetical protein JWP97_958, partial [Labilithrix sp.]|nr:hypothetical protein [Labilithrix sp.]
MSEEPLDIFALDREVRRAAQRAEQLRARLATGTRADRELAKQSDPFTSLRGVATKTTYDALAALQPSILDVPLRDGLLRWVYELLQARVGLDLQLADADTETELDARLTAAQAAAHEADEKARGATGAGGDARSDDALTYRDALRGILRAKDEGRAAAALARAGELAIRTAAVRKERRLRRFEAARRLGLSHPWALATKIDVRGLAQTFLDASEPLAEALLKRAQKGNETPWRASSAMHLGLGHGAQAGWPAHLGTRWLDETFGALA